MNKMEIVAVIFIFNVFLFPLIWLLKLSETTLAFQLRNAANYSFLFSVILFAASLLLVDAAEKNKSIDKFQTGIIWSSVLLIELAFCCYIFVLASFIYKSVFN